MESKQKSVEKIRLVFLIPHYNHLPTIKELIKLLAPYDIPILIVDDGSSIETKDALKKLVNNNITLIQRKQNGGKGAAVKDGFKYAKEQGYTHAFQIDADLQHNTKHIQTFLTKCKENPKNIICAKPIYTNAPKGRFYARKITNFFIAINTLGLDIKDAMCGMRIYPLDLIMLLPKIKSNRMDFDIEIIILAFRNGLQFIWIETEVSYNKAISHFRLLRDNLLISKIHAKYCLLLPKYIYQKMQKQQHKMWYKRNEKAGKNLLNLTIFLVSILPRILLKPIIFCVTGVYFLTSKNERENIRQFYLNIKSFKESKGEDTSTYRYSIYKNFYYFGEAICDKIAAWKGKITYEDLEINDFDLLINELGSGKKGHILLMSHFGNTELSRALSVRFKNIKVVIFVYQQNALAFFEMIDKISKNKIDKIYVNEIDLSKLLKIQKILDSGGHIGIMGDRISLNKARNIKLSFLNKDCYFPQGAFLLAKILNAKMSMIWCYKTKDKYKIDFEPLNYDDKGKIALDSALSKEDSIKPFMQKYINSLEQKATTYPTQWFSFYDFWQKQD